MAETSTTAAGPRYVRRFTLTERMLHWVHASAFFVLLATGLCLYIPALATTFGDRPLLKDIHFYTAISWAGAILLIIVLGNRRALRATLREIDLFDRDDCRFLAGRTHSPQGRFNAGQKVNFVLVCALFAALFITGGDTIIAGTHHNLIFAGHKLATIGVCVLVVGHLYMALVNRGTRPGLRGMLTGEVDRKWAQQHYPRWEPERSPANKSPLSGSVS